MEILLKLWWRHLKIKTLWARLVCMKILYSRRARVLLSHTCQTMRIVTGMWALSNFKNLKNQLDQHRTSIWPSCTDPLHRPESQRSIQLLQRYLLQKTSIYKLQGNLRSQWPQPKHSIVPKFHQYLKSAMGKIKNSRRLKPTISSVSSHQTQLKF